LGLPALRHQMRVYKEVPAEDEEQEVTRQQVWGQVEDLVTLYFSGFLAHRPRCAISLEAFLKEYFQLPIEVRQFQGQWLQLEPANQSVLGEDRQNNQLGSNVVAGENVWDVQGKFRICIGPLSYEQFAEFIPDRSPRKPGKSLFLLTHLTRLYAGPELAFEVQVVLRGQDVPPCQLEEGKPTDPRLGWNTWLSNLPFPHDATDACFEAEDVFDLSS
jgi:type VI secretion system protein ImpH